MGSQLMADLDRGGAVVQDKHFVYKSGKHGSGYINMDPIYTHPSRMAAIGRELLLPFDGYAVNTIAAPAVGGVSLVTYAGVQAALRWPDETCIVWADKDGKEFRFERAGFVEQIKDKWVLVVEDLLTTGGSVMAVCREVEKEGGKVVGVSAIVNRGGVTAEQLGVPRLEALTEVNFSAVDPDDCELCARHVPIVENIGHGAAYKVTHSDYEGGYVNHL